VAVDEVIELSVTSMDIEPDDDDNNNNKMFNDYSSSSCSYDCLQLLDGPDTDSEPLTARLCGRHVPATTFLTSANAATVHFRSDYFTAGTGFELDYHVVVSHHHAGLPTQRGTSTPARSCNAIAIILKVL